MINNIKELAQEVCASDDTARGVARRLYKDTNCGIGFYSESGSIVLSGYCEGTDMDCESHVLEYPFAPDEFWKLVNQADQDGCDMWDKTHGCEKCWGGEVVCDEWGNEAGPEDYGVRPVDKECKECGGNGIVI